MFEPQGFLNADALPTKKRWPSSQARKSTWRLLDMHMPKLTGLETIRRLKQLRALASCILMSAHLDEAILEQARVVQAFSVL